MVWERLSGTRRAASPFGRRTTRRRSHLQFEPLESRAVPAVFSVTSAADSGHGSLRDAINRANNATGLDTISFNIAGSGTRTIALQSELPQILDATLIDGWSQPGATSSPIIEVSAGSSGAEYGLSVFAGNSTFRGLVLNGFSSACIAIWGGDGNRIQGNYLGTNAAGTAKVGGTNVANVYLAPGSAGNVIGVDGDGVTDAREANVIGGSEQIGVWLDGIGTKNNRIAGNSIGVAATGDVELGNNWGVYISGGAQNNLVGSNLDGVADGREGNIISANRLAGVAILGDGTTGNRIARNAIYNNDGLEIDLGDDGITTNDSLDADTGPNARLNYPVLQSLSVAGSTITTTGTLKAAANKHLRLEFFAGRAADASGHGGGERFLGATHVATNSQGVAKFTQQFTGTLDYGWVVSATATDSAGNTSEFSPALWQGASLANTFALHSSPSSTKRIYLDFNGHTTTGTRWNADYSRQTIQTPAYSIDADPNFSDEELFRIQRIFQRVAEDFLPFNVDVTTQQPPVSDLIDSGGSDQRWGIRVAIGGSSSTVLGTPGGGGIAFFDSFTWNSDTPAFIFSDVLNQGGEHDVALAICHEVGHTLGLDHDGSVTSGYYAGHGTGGTSWGALMGAPYGKSVTQWSKGQYVGADQFEDDLAIITGGNGFSYRPDGVGNSLATASPLTIASASPGVGQVVLTGIIEQNTDVDVFVFDVPQGLIDLTIRPDSIDGNLDIQAELLDANGQVLATSNPLGQLSARMNTTLPAGRYYLRIDGVGEGSPLTSPSGYTDYGSLGSYVITGRVPHVNVAPTLGNAGGIASYTEDAPAILLAPNGTVTDPDSANFAGGWLTAKIINNAQSDDRLEVRHQGNAAGQIGVSGNQIRYGGVLIGTFTGGVGTAPLTISLNSSATPGGVQTLLRNLAFRTLSDHPATARRGIQLKLADGDGGMSPNAVRYVDVLRVNDAPTLSLGSAMGYQRNAAAITLAPTATVTDSDSANFAGGRLTVHIAQGAEAANRLAVGGPFTFWGQDIMLNGVRIGRKVTADGGVGLTDLVINLSANVTPSMAQQLLRAITFRTVSSTSTLSRSITFTLTDGDGGSITQTKLVNVS